MKPSNDAPVVGEDFTVVAFEGEPIELELKGADEDETCRHDANRRRLESDVRAAARLRG